jgi:hypothetical protein
MVNEKVTEKVTTGIGFASCWVVASYHPATQNEVRNLITDDS